MQCDGFPEIPEWFSEILLPEFIFTHAQPSLTSYCASKPIRKFMPAKYCNFYIFIGFKGTIGFCRRIGCYLLITKEQIVIQHNICSPHLELPVNGALK
jgi:hypothetical protein